RRASILCDLGSVLAVGLVPVLHRAGALPLPALVALVAVAGALRGPGDNAKHVLLPDAAARAATPLERASRLYDGVNRAAGLLGAPLAGVLIGVFGAAEVLLVDAATFLAGALAIAVLVPAPDPKTAAGTDADGGGYLVRLAAGVRFLLGERLLLAIAVMLFVTNLLDQAYTAVLLPVWSREEGHAALGVGLVGGAFALGATLGSLGLAAVGPRLPRRTTFLVAFLLAGAPRYAVMALGAPLAVLLAVAVCAGLAAGALNPILAVVELERVPERLRARVLAASTAISFGACPSAGCWVAGSSPSPASTPRWSSPAWPTFSPPSPHSDVRGAAWTGLLLPSPHRRPVTRLAHPVPPHHDPLSGTRYLDHRPLRCGTRSPRRCRRCSRPCRSSSGTSLVKCRGASWMAQSEWHRGDVTERSGGDAQPAAMRPVRSSGRAIGAA
nr:MFS transporter [Actinomycetota bacterium]